MGGGGGGIYDLNGWGIYGSNAWGIFGSYGKVSCVWEICSKNTGLRGLPYQDIVEASLQK